MSFFGLLSAMAVQVAVTNGVRVGWFEEMMPALDGVKLYTCGVVPKEGVKCPIVIQRNPDVCAFYDGRVVIPAGYQGLLLQKTTAKSENNQKGIP